MAITTAAAVRFDPQMKKKEEAAPLALDIVQYEILPRLPAKSICRFKCVSKQWKLFLSSHMFGNMHHLRHINNKTYRLLLLDNPGKPLLNHTVVGFNRLEKADPRFDLVLASLDGLVCVASTKTITGGLALWNPLTGAYHKLPSHPDFFPTYDPRWHIIGFYSDSSNDYKLLYVVGNFDVYIYSQRLNSWRQFEFVIENYGERSFDQWSQAIFCDQSLYFWVERLRKCLLHNHHDAIICFDVNTEVFRIIQLPPLPSGAIRLHSSLVAIDGCIHLCVAYCIDYAPFKQGNMWKLINGDSWAEVAFFPGVPYVCTLDSPKWPIPPSVCVTRNARDSWIAIIEGNNNSFDEIMNMEEFTLTDHSASSSSVRSPHPYSRIIYEETLVSPNPPPP